MSLRMGVTDIKIHNVFSKRTDFYHINSFPQVSYFKCKSMEEMFKRGNIELCSCNFFNNSINGKCFIIENACFSFYKYVEYQKGVDELQGAVELCDKYKIPRILKVISSETHILICYEYLEEIEETQGLLQNFLESEDSDNDRWQAILEQYQKNLLHITVHREYPLMQFFNVRIKNRLFQWYNINSFNYTINNGRVLLREIVQKSAEYFSQDRVYKCFYTQGDPNSLNILTNGYFVDLATAGCNCLEAELCMAFWSFLIGDIYLFPKYHPDSYHNCPSTIKNHVKYEPVVQLIGDEIKVPCLLTSRNRKKFLQEYINIYKGKALSTDIKYFFVIRILTIFNLFTLDEKDRLYCMYCAMYFYSVFEVCGQPLEALEVILKEVEER